MSQGFLIPRSRISSVDRLPEQSPAIADPDAPTWETPTWADSIAFDKLYARGEAPLTAARAAMESGDLSRSEYEYYAAGISDEARRSRFERLLGYKDHRGGFFGNLENVVGLLETVSGFRFLVSSSKAVLEGLKDPESGLRVGGFGLAFSTKEFSEAWHGRTHYSDVFASGGWSHNFATGLLADVLLDPATWLTFGVGASSRVIIGAESKAAGILAKNASSYGAEAVKLGGSLSLTRYGEAIMKLAGRHYVVAGNRSAVLRSVMEKRGIDAPPDLVGRLSDTFGIARKDIMPEHLAEVMKRPEFRTELTEFAVEHHEALALEHLDLMRGGLGTGTVARGKSILHADKWTPEALASRMNLRRGPVAMFNETAGIFGRDIGLPTDRLLGSAALELNEFRGTLSDALADGRVPTGLKAATKFVGFGSGVAEGAIDTSRKWFMSALERTPFEERIAVQGILDQGAQRMAANARAVAEYFSTPVEMTLVDGSKVAHRMSLDDRRAISMALDNPNEYMDDLPDHLRSAADWVSNQFERIFREEERYGVGGQHLENYVSHIYGTRASSKIMDFLKEYKIGAEAIKDIIPVDKIWERNPFSGHRAIATFDDAIEAWGKNAVELDIANILHRRFQVSGRMIAKQTARSYMVSKYAIGGMSASLIIELDGHQKMMRLANYAANYIDTGPAVKSSEAQHKLIDLALERIAYLDLDKMGKRSGEFGKRIKRPIPGEQVTPILDDVDVPHPEIGPAHPEQAGKRVVKEGEVYKQEEIFRNAQLRTETRGVRTDWFQDLPEPKKGISDADARQWLDESGFDVGRGKHARRMVAFAKRRMVAGSSYGQHVEKNRQLINRVIKAGFGKNKLSDLTAGEADFLHDFLQGFIKPGLMADKKGSVRGALWRSKDELGVYKLEGGVIKTGRPAFREAESGHIVRSEAPVRTIDDRTARTILAKRGTAVDDESVAAVKREFTKSAPDVSLADMELKTIKDRLTTLRHQVEGLGREIRVTRKSYSRVDAEKYERHMKAIEGFEAKLHKAETRAATVERLTEARLAVRQKWLAFTSRDIDATTSKIAEIEADVATTSARAIKTRKELEERIVRLRERLPKLVERRAGIQKDIDTIDDWKKAKAGSVFEDIERLKKDIANEKVGRAKTTPAYDARQLERQLAERKGLYEGQYAELEGRLPKADADRMDGTYILPRSFVQAIDEMLDSGFNYTKMHHRMLSAWQKFQRVWKVSLTLPFAEHHARNYLTSVGLTYTHMGLRMLNPQNWSCTAHVVGHLLYRQQRSRLKAIGSKLPKGARDAFVSAAAKAEEHWGKAKFVTETGVELTYKEVGEAAVARGLNQAFVFAEIGIPPYRKFDNVSNGVLVGAPKWLREQVWNVVRETSHTAETVTDIPLRMMMFTDEVLRGKSFDQAAEVVRSHLNDWSRLSGKEKVYMRTAMPFYSWFQFSLERFFKDAIETPGRFIMPFKVTRNIQGMISGEPPEGYVPQYLNERLGIWSDSNEHGYYKKLIGFGQNQEDAFRQMSAMSALGRLVLNAVASSISDDLGAVTQAVTGGKPHSDEAPLRFLSQMDFVTKSVVEGVVGREFFSGSPTGTRPEFLIAERSRLEQGKGFAQLDQGIPGSVGGKWLKEWLEYTEDSGRPEVSARRRWILGQLPVSRFVSQYEQRIRHKNPGEVNYLSWAAETLGVSAYRYHPQEGKYYRDRARIEALARLARQAHLIKSGAKYWDMPEEPDIITKDLWARLKREREEGKG